MPPNKLSAGSFVTAKAAINSVTEGSVGLIKQFSQNTFTVFFVGKAKILTVGGEKIALQKNRNFQIKSV